MLELLITFPVTDSQLEDMARESAKRQGYAPDAFTPKQLIEAAIQHIQRGTSGWVTVTPDMQRCVFSPNKHALPYPPIGEYVKVK